MMAMPIDTMWPITTRNTFVDLFLSLMIEFVESSRRVTRVLMALRSDMSPGFPFP